MTICFTSSLAYDRLRCGGICNDHYTAYCKLTDEFIANLLLSERMSETDCVIFVTIFPFPTFKQKRGAIKLIVPRPATVETSVINVCNSVLQISLAQLFLKNDRQK